MIRVKNIFHVLFILSNLAKPVFCGDDAKFQLAKSNSHFDKGEYSLALSLIKNIDVRVDFDSSEDMLLAFKIRAISYSELGQIDKASETIRELLFLEPNYKFDLFDTPSSTVDLANQEREKIDEKNQMLAIAKNELVPAKTVKPEEDLKNNILIEKKIFIEKPPHFLLATIPFGANHFISGSPQKGIVYLAAQVLGLSVNIGAFWWKQSYLEKYGGVNLKKNQDQNKFETAQTIQYVALGGLFLAYAISLIDALVNWPKSDA